MPSFTTRAMLSAVIAGAVAFGAAATASTAAAAQPGQVCQIRGDRYGTVFRTPAAHPGAGDLMYTIQPLQWFRVVGYSDSDHYLGHGDGQPDGYMRREYVEQSTCHFT